MSKKSDGAIVKETMEAMASREIQLGELLTEAQYKHCLKLMESPDFHKPLQAYLESIEPKLESKGMLPDFFAYWLEWAKMEGRLP